MARPPSSQPLRSRPLSAPFWMPCQSVARSPLRGPPLPFLSTYADWALLAGVAVTPRALPCFRGLLPPPAPSPFLSVGLPTDTLSRRWFSLAGAGWIGSPLPLGPCVSSPWLFFFPFPRPLRAKRLTKAAVSSAPCRQGGATTFAVTFLRSVVCWPGSRPPCSRPHRCYAAPSCNQSFSHNTLPTQDPTPWLKLLESSKLSGSSSWPFTIGRFLRIPCGTLR